MNYLFLYHYFNRYADIESMYWYNYSIKLNIRLTLILQTILL